MRNMKSIYLTTELRAEADSYLPSAERILSGHPEQRVRIVLPDAGNGAVGGIWECEVGAYRIQYGANEHELCHILSGEVRLHDDQGQAAQFGPGDVFQIPGGFKGVWETLAPLRKSFLTTTDDTPATSPCGLDDVIRFDQAVRASSRFLSIIADVPHSVAVHSETIALAGRGISFALERPGHYLLGVAQGGTLTMTHGDVHTSVMPGESFFVAAECQVRIKGESDAELSFMTIGEAKFNRGESL